MKKISEKHQLNTHVLRFGNYLAVTGSHNTQDSDYDHHDLHYELRFNSANIIEQPEFTFTQTVDGHEESTRFLQLYWIDGSGLFEASDQSPLHLFMGKKESLDGNNPYVINDIIDNDYDGLLKNIKSIDQRSLWENRVVWEILYLYFEAAPSSEFISAALNYLGWSDLHSNVEKRLGENNAQLSINELVKLQCHCIATMDVVYVTPNLKSDFISKSLEIELSEFDGVLVDLIITQLRRIGEGVACEFAHHVINSVSCIDRESIAKLMIYCLPPHSKWWAESLLKNEWVGDEQVADALNVLGAASAAQFHAPLAKLCFSAALKVSARSQSAAWNAGLLCISERNYDGAKDFLSKVGRHYPSQSAATTWPTIHGRSWPESALDAEALFDLPDGCSEWPKISIITPSYNQGEYIEETILSIINQNYPNLQYIVVDGNSSDTTHEVLEKYKLHIDHLIIEPDNGQTEALNKGFRLANGELISWLNSDDMYGPGSLHAVALKWLENETDLIAGFCTEHSERELLLINKPAATNADFNVPALGRIFEYWLKGYFFYQPELFFSKRILDEAGLLDESLYYAMDYDLWVRFAKAGATMETISWPIAFFRKHDQQKTFNLVETIEEQARVRTKHYKLAMDDLSEANIKRKLIGLRKEDGGQVVIITKRIDKIFSTSMQHELDTYCNHQFQYHLTSDEEDPAIKDANLVIHLAHVLTDLEIIDTIREANTKAIIATWFWDNHHHVFENYATATKTDIVIPGHALYGEYLRNDQSLYGKHVPLCVTQWSRHEVEAWFPKADAETRNNGLYGGFVNYAFEPERTLFLEKVMGKLENHSLKILSEDKLKDYFARSEKERFEEWCSYSCSLVLPLRNDLSQRVFDALLAGQIPLVPHEIRDLDTVIPPEVQEDLPIIRFSMKDPDDCIRAYRDVVERLENESPDCRNKRHLFALNHYTFSSKIDSVVDQILNA
jgi:glycosyltransferase involved in cell wall biosynthesis